MIGVPRGTRTPTNGFGDRSTAIILERHCLYYSKLLMMCQLNGAPEETRTPKIWLLRPTRIPIPSPGHYTLLTIS